MAASSEQERLTSAEVASQRRLLRGYGQSLRSISRYAEAGNAYKVENAVVSTLKSFSARSCALILDVHSSRRVARMTDIEERAAKLDLCRPCTDPVAWKGEAKLDGTIRATLSFGWRHRAQQRVLRDAFLASGVWNPYEHSSGTKGPGALVREIASAFEAGYRYWVVADIKDCFASVRPGHLHGLLPLKRGAAWKGIIFLPSNTPISGIPENLEGAARSGLPTGSLVSPRIASALLGREIRAVMSGAQGVAVSFADDIAIGARTLKESEAIKDALCDRLTSLNSGPLAFKYIKIVAAVDGIDIVGRRIRLKHWDGDRKIHVQPSPRAFERLRLKAQQEFGTLGQLGELERTLLHDYVRRWATAHDWTLQPGWEDIVIDVNLLDPHALGIAELPEMAPSIG